MPKRPSCVTCAQRPEGTPIMYRAASFCCTPCRSIYVAQLRTRQKQVRRTRTRLLADADLVLLAPRDAHLIHDIGGRALTPVG